MVSVAMGQTPPGGTERTDVPAAAVTLEPAAGGATLVQITMVDERYPVESLSGRIRAMQPPARGLRMTVDDLGGKGSLRPAVRAVFAADGLVGSDGTVRLEPLAAALAGPGADRIGRIRIIVTPFRPTERTLRSFVGAGVRVTGAPAPGGFEYDLDLAETRTPIPDRPEKPEPIAPPRPVPESTGVVWPWLLVPAVAGGALVYSLLLRRGLRRR